MLQNCKRTRGQSARARLVGARWGLVLIQLGNVDFLVIERRGRRYGRRIHTEDSARRRGGGSGLS